MPDDPRQAALQAYRDRLTVWSLTAPRGREAPPAPPPVLRDDWRAISNFEYVTSLHQAEQRDEPLPLPKRPSWL
jgi:hypothetical protein